MFIYDYINISRYIMGCMRCNIATKSIKFLPGYLGNKPMKWLPRRADAVAAIWVFLSVGKRTIRLKPIIKVEAARMLTAKYVTGCLIIGDYSSVNTVSKDQKSLCNSDIQTLKECRQNLPHITGRKGSEGKP